MVFNGLELQVLHSWYQWSKTLVIHFFNFLRLMLQFYFFGIESIVHSKLLFEFLIISLNQKLLNVSHPYLQIQHHQEIQFSSSRHQSTISQPFINKYSNLLETTTLTHRVSLITLNWFDSMCSILYCLDCPSIQFTLDHTLLPFVVTVPGLEMDL